MSLNGIDLSHYTKVTDWTALAASGVQFVYLKATEGITHTDARFADYWHQAKAAGLPRGAYHFFHPASSPEAQADHFCAVMGSLEPGDLPPALDLEETQPAPDEWPSVPAAKRVGLILRFVERLTTHCSLRPIIYTRRGWVADYLPDPAALAGYQVWLADYRGLPAPAVPAPWHTWTFWQHSDAGKVPGVVSPVDLNRFFGSRDDLQAISMT